MLKRIMAEATGSLIISLAISTSTATNDRKLQGNQYLPVVAGFALFLSYSLTGFVSGHFNPAVTLGTVVKKLLGCNLGYSELAEYALYLAAQAAGAFLGFMAGWGITGNLFYFKVFPGYDYGDTIGYVKGSTEASAFFGEFVYTIIVAGCALNIGKTSEQRVVSAIGAGLAYWVSAEILFYISGGCLNPLFGLMANLLRVIFKGDDIGDTWVFVLAPLFGGLACGIFGFIFEKELSSKNQKPTESVLKEEEEYRLF